MTSREQRNLRRAAERKQKKLEARKTAQTLASFDSEEACSFNLDTAAGAAPAASAAQPASIPSSQDAETYATPIRRTRAEINRANARHSTGPRTTEGKARSSRNSFKHGLYSAQLVLPDEDPEKLDQLKRDLRREHQPVNTTEEILVNELAEHFWRLRRMREWETLACMTEPADELQKSGFVCFIQRTMASAERNFHKSLAALTKLQKVRGFVPLNLLDEVEETQPAEQTEADEPLDSGFVPSISPIDDDDPREVTPEVEKFLAEVGKTPAELSFAERYHLVTCTPAELENLKSQYRERELSGLPPRC